MNARHLDQWQVKGELANDRKTVIYSLVGRIVKEPDGFKPALRFTRTSPIAKCEGNIVTTASGTKYLLLEPFDSEKEINKNQYISDEYCNPWIDGDNWMTI